MRKVFSISSFVIAACFIVVAAAIKINKWDGGILDHQPYDPAVSTFGGVAICSALMGLLILSRRK